MRILCVLPVIHQDMLFVALYNGFPAWPTYTSQPFAICHSSVTLTLVYHQFPPSTRIQTFLLLMHLLPHSLTSVSPLLYSQSVMLLVLLVSCTLMAGETISEEYKLEYGTDKIEMHKGAVGPDDRVLVVDDLIATGGTLGAGIKLIGDSMPRGHAIRRGECLLLQAGCCSGSKFTSRKF